MSNGQPDLILSKADNSDLPELLDLYKHLVPTDPEVGLETAEQVLKAFNAFGDSAIVLGRVDGTLVCSCVLLIVPNLTRGAMPYGLIENVVTHTDYRGRGFGQAILGHALNDAWDAGCYKVMLMTGSKKPETIAFYEKCGFEASKIGFQIRKIAPRSE